ncbi:DUF6228 family protein [Streptomyces sp. BH055]|uniref:DUF6228 family protein n=1 Tax=Streptomyces sp. BH055 TaxID=3401173 RepID=UPI003BB5F7D8
MLRVGVPELRPVHLLFSESSRPYGDDPTLDFLVTARGRWGNVSTCVRTWDGDGLDTFLALLAEDFRGWQGERTWRSLEYDLSISAEHRSGGRVHLTWGIHDRAPLEEWHFETTTVHAAGEDMRNLAAEMSAFLANLVP